MNKLTTILFISLFSALCANAKSWIDVTDTYVKNPRYDNNDYSYWEGTRLSGNNPKENAEHYQKNYDTYQEIEGLAPGTYRVSLNAFYRMGTSDQDYERYTSGNYSSYQYARLYASSSVDTKEVGIKPLGSAALQNSLGGGTASLGWWTGPYVPNNMEAANYWFNAGYYKNQLQCEVGSDGKLTIGIRKNQTISSDWTCLDNWKLEYWGDVKNVEKISFDKSSYQMDLGEKMIIDPIITPSDATYQKVTWTAKNTKVATVSADGVITAVGIGRTTLVATAIDEAKVKGEVEIVVEKNTPSKDNIVINEIMAANVDVYLDPNQNFGSWVELYNPSDKSVNIEGLYISDNTDNLKKNRLVSGYGTIPAHGFAILNFDHHEVWTEMSYRQIDDKLDCDGGKIIISDGNTIIAEMDYPEAISRVSYARTTDGGDTWGYAGYPTPGTSNVNGAFASEQLDAPIIDKDAQLFNGSLQICVNIPTGAKLVYTTDGSTPTLENGDISNTGIFQIYKNTVFRFRLYKEGYLPSKVVTRSYLTNNNESFPVISIVTDDKNIYDKDRGAFMQGNYGRPGNGQTSRCNWNMDWDHPVNFEYITTDNECVISQECDFAMCGGWSRAWTPHSFKLKASKTYDLMNTFDYQFFADKPGLKHKTLQIRNGGNDTSNRIKDPALQAVISRSGLYVDYQAWQPVHVYLNGNSYAILNMREPNNKHHAYTNYGIDTDEMDQFEMSPDSGYVQMEGTKEAYDKWYDLSFSASDPKAYEEIKELVDIDEYINYMACQLYTGNWDWPQNNVKGFRDRNNGKFHFVLFDLDGALSTDNPFETFFGKEYYQFDTLHGYDYSQNTSVEGTRRYLEIQFVTIFKNMLENDEFRKKFIDAYCIVNGSLFDPNRVKDIVNEAASYLSMGNDVNPWNTANDLINSFSSSRQTTMIYRLKNHGLFQIGTNGQTASLSTNNENAKIYINDQVVPTGKLKGTVFAPITLKTSAPAGYKFLGWTTKNTTAEKSIFNTKNTWKFNDTDNLDGKNWKSSTYDDSSWKTGRSPIGYGKSDVTSSTSQNKLTYYLRKTFSLATDPKSSDVFTLNYTIDDGMVVYINGQEAGRYNMPGGYVSYNTPASSYAQDNPDTGSMELPASLFKKGDNVIAVEIHNNSTSSSDILWEASLTQLTETTNSISYVSKEKEYTCSTTGNITLTAVWEKMTEEEMIAEGINTAPVVINEISASNSVYVNDYFKKNDWIELYNQTSEDVDIAGLFISDNLNKPTKYQVPENEVTLNTVIPANGYKVIWCDKLDNISDVIHTSFKLAAEGGDVMILKNDSYGYAEYSDTITYVTHLGQQSFGRYPDAGSKTYVLDKPTPGKENIYTSYAVEYIAPIIEPEEPNSIAMVRDGGMTIAYVDGVVNVKSEDSNISSVNVFSASGAKVAAEITRNTGSFVTVNVGSLPRGIYVAIATNADGDTCKVKFIIK